MRDSGLAHILAISGLHMAIMAGTVFWLTRALLALVPGLALRFPIRKWAAVTALVAASFYLALSGAGVPTVRSWIMMSIVLLAVMLDRPALTMRNVALAALAILIVAPESLFHPSFDMSFAAVVALVALFEWISTRQRNLAGDLSLAWRTLRYGFLILGGTALTTLAASLAIAPFAVYHFHRLTHFGLAANLLVTPIIGLLVMPMALVSLIAMPFDLEAWPLQAMGFGIELMVATGKWVGSWPGAVSILPTIPGTALLLMALGGLWLCLWHTRWRALGLVIAAAGLLLAPGGTRPDVLIERQGATAALRSDDGVLAFPTAMAANYSTEMWLLADGDERDFADALAKSSFRCDLQGCVGKVKGKTVAFIRHPSALEEDCRIADIVIVPFSVGRRCSHARIVVDRRMLWSEGAHALYIEGLSIRTESVAQARGQRPWVLARPITRPPQGSTSGRALAREEDEPENGIESNPED